MTVAFDLKKTSFKHFMLERSFHNASVIHRISEKPVLLKPEQLAAVKKEAYDSGYEEGKNSVSREQIELQNQQNSVLENQNRLLSEIINKANEIVTRLNDTLKEQEDEIKRVVLILTKKILPAFASKFGSDDIAAVVGNALEEMKREPQVIVKLSGKDYEVLHEKLQKTAESMGFQGKLVVISDENIKQGDCLIDWTEGGAERNIDNTLNEIEKILTVKEK